MPAGSEGFVKTRFILILAVLMTVVAAAAQTPREAEGPSAPVLVTGAEDYNSERQLVTLGVGRDEGVSVGDRFWMFKQDNITGTGSVYLVSATRSVGRLSFTGKGLGGRQSAVVLVSAALPGLRQRLSPGVAIRSTVARVPPARRTAWVGFGRRSGLRQGDPVLIRRLGIPISRGRLEIVDEEVSLAELQPLVGNALPEPGDEVEIWPPPGVGQEVRLSSTILEVATSREGPVITFVGTATDGLVDGRLVDIFRKGQYVGAAVVRQVYDPLSQALVMDSATRSTPEVGDTVLVRLAPGEPSRPLTAAVFKVAADYCLIAAGESDGVQLHEKFVVRGPIPGSPGALREVAELTVETVKVDYAGARIRPLVGDGTVVKAWDMAERRSSLRTQEWLYAGRIDLTHPESRTLVAVAEPEAALSAGQVVRWVPVQGGEARAGGAVVVYVGQDKLFLFVPPAWGNLEEAPGARIETVQEVAGGHGQPASAPAGTTPR